MSSCTEGLHITDNPACNEFMREEWGDFPKVQFDCGLDAELSGETVDINKEALRETLEKNWRARRTMGRYSIDCCE